MVRTFFIYVTFLIAANLAHSLPSLGEVSPKEPSKINWQTDAHPLSRDRYIASGIIGSLLGFGIGHAIQERYKEKGWIFTLTDALSVGTILGGFIDLNIRNREHGKTGDVSIGTILPGLTIAGVGALALFGFRIWQAIDLWTAEVEPGCSLLYLHNKKTCE